MITTTDGVGVSAGLSSAQAVERFREFGPNAIVEKATHPWRELILETLRDPMLWFLAGTALLYGLLGEVTESIILAGAMLPLIAMDGLLHWRAQASTAGLKSLLAATARVIRDGVERDLPAAQLVPGDVVLLRANESIPADGHLLEAEGLQVDESLLTGEALPVRKSMDDPPSARGLFAGTRVLAGTGAMELTATGARTQYGGIVRLAQGGSHERTPLQLAMDRLVRGLTISAGGLCILLFGVQMLRGQTWLEALVSAATLAIAALPEEFPVVFTVFLSVGVLRLAKQKALVRRLVAVENIGRVTCIATDKTGTITSGQLELTHLLPMPGIAEDGLLLAAATASRRDAEDPLDRAIFAAADVRNLVPVGRIVATFPFTEGRRRETALEVIDGAGRALTKGAPETIFALTNLSAEASATWQAQVESLSAEGHKVIAIAGRPNPAGSLEEPASGYVFLGLIALEDPVRPEVPAAVAACRAAGIQVVMVTGDHPATALAIAREAGIVEGPVPVFTGAELEAQSTTMSVESLKALRVVARAMPAQKLQLVEALQRAGMLVAVSGDGINDAPALRAADVGIAMGARGAQTTREVASLVLLDDNFATIVRAVAEAEALFGNLRRSFTYLITIHAPLVLTAAVLPIVGYPTPFLPIHIVWLELLIHPTALLAFQAEGAQSLSSVREGRASFFTRAQMWRLVAIGLLLTIVVSNVASAGRLDVGAVTVGRSLAMACLIMISGWSAVSLGAWRNALGRWVVALTVGISVLLMQWDFPAAALHVVTLEWSEWGMIAAVTGIILGVGLFRWR